MKTRPISFTGEMVRATLAGQKTTIRQCIPLPSAVETLGLIDDNDGIPAFGYYTRSDIGELIHVHCPYGVPGDQLWVRETWAVKGRHTDTQSVQDISANPQHFRVWFKEQCYNNGREKFNLGFLGKWRSLIHMPCWASRITLEVKTVKAERVQEIVDGKKPGCSWMWVIGFEVVS